MSERGAHALVSTMEGWVWAIGQPILVLLVFAVYYLQARTTESPLSGLGESAPDHQLSKPHGETDWAGRRSPVARTNKPHRFTSKATRLVSHVS
jgi:hypothetical protein